MHTIYIERFQQLLNRPPVKREPVKSLFFEQNKNTIFHQKNSISLSRIDAERLAIATNELLKASAALHGAFAALAGFEGIDKSQLNLAHGFIDTYIFQFSEYSLQSVGARKPHFEAMQKARNGGA